MSDAKQNPKKQGQFFDWRQKSGTDKTAEEKPQESKPNEAPKINAPGFFELYG